MKKYLKYYLTGYIVIVLLITIITFRNSFYSSVIFKDYLLTVLVAGLILTILFMLSDIFTLVMINFINIKTTKDITAHDDLVTCMNVNPKFHLEKQLELNKVVTALDELVCWASQGYNNPDVLDSAKVIENYLGVRQ